MISKLKAVLHRCPMLYKACFTLYMWLRATVDLPRYAVCRLLGREYFGPVMLGGQTWGSRAPHMRSMLESELRSKQLLGEFLILEIGTWAGQSAILWAAELVRQGRQGRVICVDPWAPFVKPDQVGINTAMSMMDYIARRDKIFSLFWHNVKSTGLQSVIVPIRARSQDILPFLSPLAFDVIYVDGSHAYSDITTDLLLAAPLLKDGGVICGDDLERQFDEVDTAHALLNCEKDFVRDTRTGCEYHPGVCVGIHHFFKKRVSNYGGFWVQRKGHSGWSDVVW